MAGRAGVAGRAASRLEKYSGQIAIPKPRPILSRATALQGSGLFHQIAFRNRNREQITAIYIFR